MAHIGTRTVGGERRYDVCWRTHGKSRSKTFTRRADAQRFKVEIERKAALGLLYEAPAVTLAAAREGWRSRWMIGKAGSTVARKDEAWPHVAAIEHVPLDDLRADLLGDTIAAAARVAPRQAQIVLQTVKQVLRDAQTRGQRFQPELLAVTAPGYDEREPVFLSFDEVEVVAGWCSQPRLVVFLALSGLRIGEALALRDSEVDRESRSVRVERSARRGLEGPTKTRKKRRVYLCERAWQVLLEQLVARPVSVRGLVFPSPHGLLWDSNNFRSDCLGPAVARACSAPVDAEDVRERIGEGRRDVVARMTTHDLRHSFASLMIAAGANPLHVAEALGHSDASGRPDPTLIWKRYAHLYSGSGQVAASVLDRHLAAVAS